MYIICIYNLHTNYKDSTLMMSKKWLTENCKLLEINSEIQINVKTIIVVICIHYYIAVVICIHYYKIYCFIILQNSYNIPTIIITLDIENFFYLYYMSLLWCIFNNDNDTFFL